MTAHYVARAIPSPTRDQILDAALRLFDATGYSAATIEDIRLQSGVSVGTIYHHFGRKEGIAAELYVQSLRLYRRPLLEVLRPDRPAAVGIRGIVRHHLTWVKQNKARARFLMRRRETEVVRAAEADVAAYNTRLFEDVERWYRPLVEAGELRDVPLDLLYAIVLGPAQEYSRHWLEGNVKTPIDKAERTLADAAWEGLKAGPPRIRT